MIWSSTLFQLKTEFHRRGFEAWPFHTFMAIHIGDAAPNFELKNANASVGDIRMTLEESRGENGLIVVFECNHCPYVIANISRMDAMAGESNSAGIGFVGINSNDPLVYPDDSYENMEKRAQAMPYPYLHDSTQDVAHAYGAKRTPEFFLFDSELTLVYKGRMDDSPRNPTLVQTNELRDAVEAMLNGKKPLVSQTESIGCSVKWKA